MKHDWGNYEIIDPVNGGWVEESHIPKQRCRKCKIIRREDDNNNPCPGKRPDGIRLDPFLR